jgi:protein TonB
MTEHRLPKYLTGSISFGIYFLVIALLVYYFNTKSRQESKHYVKENKERIQVALATPDKHPTPKPKPKPQEKSKSIVKPKPPKKESIQKPKEQKKVIKEKVVKKVKKEPKKKDVNTTAPKKVNKPKSLFANVTSSKPKEPKKEPKKVETKPNVVKPNMDLVKVKEKTSAAALVSSSIKIQESSDRGIENAYLANIEEKLKGWPAQSEYAGEKARVMLNVESSGMFTYKIVSGSSIPEFNMGLDAYLKQLQRFGFGSHEGDRAYKLDVEFIATE